MFIGKVITSLLAHPGLSTVLLVFFKGAFYKPPFFHLSSSSCTLRSGKISCTTCRDILRDTLSQLGYNPNDYGLHSLRSGGITSAVRNSSNLIPERLLKIHGRWKSDSAKDMHVEESLENRLQVTNRTRYLGL